MELAMEGKVGYDGSVHSMVEGVKGRVRQGGRAGYIGGKYGGENETRRKGWYIGGKCGGENETRRECWVYWWEVWRGE